MKRYDKYKDSGEDWIGKIPEHWEIIKLKYLGSAIIGLTYSPNDLCNENEGTLVLRSSNLQNGKFVYGEKENSYVSSRIPQKLFIKKNDILICSRNGSRDLIGKCAIATISDEGNTFGAFTTVFRSKLNPYLFNILNSNIFKNLSGSFLTSTINQLTIGNLNSIYVPIPSHSEQQTIASFLDDKTTKIDQTISIKEKEIELLKERRQILIQKAVTKGLDDKVKFKDSGVEWIGEIPEHWEITSVKNLLKIPITDGPHTTPHLYDEGIPFISAEAIKNNKIDFSKIRGFISERDHKEFCKKYKPQRNDIYMVKSGATTGNIAIVETDEEFSIWSPLAVFRANHRLKPNFLFFALQSVYFKKGVELKWSYGTQQNIGMGVLSNLPLVYTTYEEQTHIVSYLEKIEEKISKAISLKQQEIEKLKEYKTVLIDNVVTGKIKVS